MKTPFTLPARLLMGIAALHCGPTSLAGVEFTYSLDVGVIDVTQDPWNFDNTGTEDITAKFQQLVDETIPRKTWLTPEGYWPSIIYFPNGTYRLTDSVVGAILDFGAALGGLVIQGQSRDGVVLKLDDNAPGFNHPGSPKHVLDYFAGNSTNNAFINGLENLTIAVGAGNPGAVGVRFHANNTGAVRNVRIVSLDHSLAGFAGLEAVKHTNGPWLIRGLEVVGFDTGLNLGGGQNGRHMVSILDLRLEGQRQAGMRLQNLIVNVLKASSANSVPFIDDLTPSGMINIIDTELGTPGGVAVEGGAIGSASPVFLRNLAVSGYSSVVHAGGEILLAEMPAGTEWHSHSRNFLWEETADLSLDLGMELAPEIAWPESSDWAVVENLNSDGDDTEAVRAAMASGKSMVIFKPGTYRISDTIRIPPHVRIVAGQWALFRTETGLTGDGRPVFEVGPSDHAVILLEKIRGRFDSQANPNPLILNASNSTLVLRDIFWVSGPVYRSEPTRGKVFIENAHSLPGSQNRPRNVAAYEFRGQDVWAYQWNPEMLFPHALVDGAVVRIFGYKTGEMRGPMVDVRNHGYAEIFGGSMNVTHDHLDIEPADTVMLLAEDGNVSANFIEMAQLSGPASGWGRHNAVAVETRGGQTRKLLNTDESVMHRTLLSPQYGAVVNLYTGYFDQDNPLNRPPSVEVRGVNPDWTGYDYTFRGLATDPDAYPAASPKLHWRVISGPGMARIAEHVGEVARISFERAGVYQVEASATDGALEASRVLSVRVLPKRYYKRMGRYDVNRYVDNAPQDGNVDLFHPALLQVGDDALNAHSHLKFEIALAALKGSANRLQSAGLMLRIDTVDNLANVVASYAADPGYGIHDADDFRRERIALGSISLAGRSAGDWVSLDIREALVNGLHKGDDFAVIWLESDFTNDSVANLVRFSSTVASDASQRPEIRVDFSPAKMRESSIGLGGSAFLHPVFGNYHDFPPWIYHHPLGWLYADPAWNNAEELLLYSPGRGWLFTSDLYYPWMYAYGTPGWFVAN